MYTRVLIELCKKNIHVCIIALDKIFITDTESKELQFKELERNINSEDSLTR